MKIIKTGLIFYDHKYQQTAGNANTQPCNIQDRIHFVSPQVAKRYLDVISDHSNGFLFRSQALCWVCHSRSQCLIQHCHQCYCNNHNYRQEEEPETNSYMKSIFLEPV